MLSRTAQSLQERLLALSGANSTQFLTWIDALSRDDEAIFGLIELMGLDNEPRCAQYASHLMLHIARRVPRRVQPNYNLLLDHVLISKNISVQRNGLGALICMPLLDYRLSELLDWLLAILQQPKSTAGLVLYAVNKLAQFHQNYPDLRNELEQSIELCATLTGSKRDLDYFTQVLRGEKRIKG